MSFTINKNQEIEDLTCFDSFAFVAADKTLHSYFLSVQLEEKSQESGRNGFIS